MKILRVLEWFGLIRSQELQTPKSPNREKGLDRLNQEERDKLYRVDQVHFN